MFVNTVFLNIIVSNNSGSLPPDARKQQAKLFNDPLSGYNILVASDAIGMGLNLAIRRIVFSSVEKFDGRCDRLLTTAVRYIHIILLQYLIINLYIFTISLIILSCK